VGLVRNLRIGLGKASLPLDVFITKATNYDILLGNDFLGPLGAKIDYSQNLLEYQIDPHTRGSVAISFGGPANMATSAAIRLHEATGTTTEDARGSRSTGLAAAAAPGNADGHTYTFAAADPEEEGEWTSHVPQGSTTSLPSLGHSVQGLPGGSAPPEPNAPGARVCLAAGPVWYTTAVQPPGRGSLAAGRAYVPACWPLYRPLYLVHVPLSPQAAGSARLIKAAPLDPATIPGPSYAYDQDEIRDVSPGPTTSTIKFLGWELPLPSIPEEHEQEPSANESQIGPSAWPDSRCRKPGVWGTPERPPAFHYCGSEPDGDRQ